MADREDQRTLIRSRAKSFQDRKVRRAEFSATPEDGWYVLDDSLKRDVKLAKDKPHDEQFEDNLWVLLSRMGFKYLSKDRQCKIQYDVAIGATQQIDVLAVDDECAVIIECKSASGPGPKPANSKTEIESLGGKKAGLHREIRTRFGKPDLKIAYVLATKNYTLKPADLERLRSFKIHHFSDADYDYYRELVEHLGSAARFQFQADLFQNQEIPEIENRVYAIEGSMGGLDYFSFSIEPERLLKLGYVLHRSKSIRVLPTYQRLIKKPRLSAIRKFINNGGYFPNSVVVNIETLGKSLRFDAAANAIEGAKAKAGVLHLPARYRSIYVIDGQHRLYAYSDSDFGGTNSIPVVAFVDLERDDQLRLFMEINENQKAVSKNLKHTLDADLKWDSKNLHDRAEGIKKQLAQELGEDVSSPLYNRVLVGEDQRTDVKVITLEAILRGLNQTPFVGKFTKDAVREQGCFNTGTSSKTLDLLKELLFGYFSYFTAEYEEEWFRLPKDGGILAINDGITALIMLLGDIIDHMVKRGEVRPLQDPMDEIVERATLYADGLKPYFRDLSEDERAALRKKYGSGAPTRLRRIFQLAVQKKRDDFVPEGLAEYWRDESKQYNVETYSRVADIEMQLRDELKDALVKMHGTMWQKRGMSEKLYTYLATEAAKKNRNIENEEDEKTPWDCLNLIHVREIMMHGAQWSAIFQKKYTIRGQENARKEDKTTWLVKLNVIRNNADHEYSVSKADAEYVAALHDWLILDNNEAIVKLTAGLASDEAGQDPESLAE